ncbi:MAG: DUF3995 domain-containing protein [Hymenobacter sp.]|nr:MAG: DUF3995 domain-containing protein [Hymenobacter sp.]
MNILVGLLLCSTFVVLAGIHAYWGLGGKWGADAALPTNAAGHKVLNPRPLECFIVAIGLMCCGLLVLVTAGLLSILLPHWLHQYGLWVLAGLFMLRALGDFKYVGFFKSVTTTPFARLDTRYYSPLCLMLSILIGCLQLLQR